MAHLSIIPILAVTRRGFKLAARVAIRDCGSQFGKLRFQKLIRDDQRLHSVARVAAASRDRLVGCNIQPVGVGLWIWFGGPA
jgi:hypothetical protein